MVSPRSWSIFLALAVSACLACAGPGASRPSAAEGATSQVDEPRSTAVSDLESVSLFSTVTPAVGFGSWAQECDPSDDPFSSCV